MASQDLMLRILLVEDNPADARLLRQTLLDAALRFELQIEGRLKSALIRLSERRFDVALLDLSLPDAEGTETVRRIHSEFPHVPIVVLTGLADEDSAMRALREGAQEYLVKGEGDSGLLVRTIRYAIERKRAEEALKHSEETFRSMIEYALDIITVLDGDGIIRYESPSAERVLGYQPRELQGRPLLRFIHPGDRELIDGLFQRESSPRPLEFRFLHKDGSWRTLEAIGQNLIDRPPLSGVIINSRDVTERKRAEEELRRANETLRAVIQTSPVAIYTLNTDGCVQSWNAAAERIFEWREAEVVGRRLPTVPPSELSAFEELMLRVLAGQNLEGVEVRRIRKDGKPVDVAVWTTLLGDGAGNIHRIVAVVADVTERKRLEEQLRQSQRIEAVGRLAGGIAHDFNNLLTIISGYSDMLLASMADGDPLRRNVEEIRKAAARAASLTSQLLAFSRRQVLQPKVVDLNEIVADMNSMLRRLIREDIELRTILDPHLGTVRADPGQISQVVVNLVVNAREAMPAGGVLTIRTANAVYRERYTGPEGAIEAGHYVVLSVTDTGHGMDANVRAHIFEPFFTTKQHGKGTGLGLSTVYGIVKQSDGEIWVASEPGRGTTFQIFLPRVDEPADARDPAAPAAAPSGAETVLLAEDEDTLRALVRDILVANGYRVIEARNGAEALQLAQCFPGEIHLLITDLVMPQLSGQELARRLAPQRSNLKILYMSGYTDEALPAHGPDNQYLQKPFTPEMLVRQVRHLLDE